MNLWAYYLMSVYMNILEFLENRLDLCTLIYIYMGI